MAKKKAAKVYDKKTNNVLVNVVLDRSGSMESGRAGTITGYNAYIDELKIDKAINYSVTMIQFDTNGGKPELTVKYRDLPIKDVPALTDAEYEPRGGTPLYDAIGECIRRVEAKGRSVLVVIITDGRENSSTEFTRASIKKLIAGKEAEGWTFKHIQLSGRKRATALCRPGSVNHGPLTRRRQPGCACGIDDCHVHRSSEGVHGRCHC
jgi:hypothetical protein